MKCILNIDDKKPLKKCLKYFNKITYTKINPNIYGDYKLIENALNYFEELLKYSETSNAIDNKLKKFFIRFGLDKKVFKGKLKKVKKTKKTNKKGKKGKKNDKRRNKKLNKKLGKKFGKKKSKKNKRKNKKKGKKRVL